jgi:hypothetical protein
MKRLLGKRLGRRAMRRALGGLLAVVLLALAGSAVAFFSAGGTGSASAAVSKLTAPTIITATPASGGTVALSWSAVTAPGEPAMTYYVTRDGGKPAGNCPAQGAATTVTSCTDTGLSVGQHSFEVTAIWRTWTATSAAKTATVTTGAVAKFTVSASASTIAAGGSANLTITAKDQSDNTVTSYTGSHSLVFSGAEASPGGTQPTVSNSSGTAIAFGAGTAIAFSSGVATVSTSSNGVLRLYRAGTAAIVATEGSITTPNPATITVNPGTVASFALAAATATPAAAAANALTITARDSYGNTAVSYAGSHSLVFSGASASPGGTAPTVSNSSGVDVAFGTATPIAFSAGVAKASAGNGGAMKLYRSGATSVKATEGAILTPTALTVTVSPGAATQLVLASSTPTPVAGTGFNLTTTAQDAYGNTATAYAGARNVTFSGASASPSGIAATVADNAGAAVSFGSPTALTFTAGVAAVTASQNGFAKLSRSGATSVSANDGTIATAAPLALTVSPGTATALAFSGLTASAGTIGSPCMFTCTVSSLGNSGAVKAKVAITDSLGNVVSNLAKSIAVTATGGTLVGSPLTTPATGSAITGGQFTYTAPSKGAFSNTITAAATGYTSATATVSK